jgi:hypothetical protein
MKEASTIYQGRLHDSLGLGGAEPEVTNGRGGGHHQHNLCCRRRSSESVRLQGTITD